MPRTSDSDRKLNQIKISQHILYILIFSLVTIVIWIVFSLFRTQRQSQIDPELEVLAEPLNPNIRVEVLTEIGRRREFSASDLSQFPIYVITGDRGNQRVVTLTEYNEIIEVERAEEAARQAAVEETTNNQDNSSTSGTPLPEPTIDPQVSEPTP